MRRFKLAFLSIIALFLIYSGGSWYIASQATRAERITAKLTPASVGLQYESVYFAPRSDTVELKGWHIEPEKPKGVVILVHGLDSHKSDVKVGLLELARKLYDRKIAVFLFDLRGHGESGDGKLSGGLFEQQDFWGAFDWLVKKGIAPHKIGALGFSLGGAIVLLAASQEPRLQAVVADSAFSNVSDVRTNEIAKRLSIPKWLAASFDPGVTLVAQIFYGIEFKKISPDIAIKKLDYPVLLIHSKTDERIPYEHSVRLKSASPNQDTVMWTVAKAEHAKAFISYPEEYLDKITEYFESRWK